MKEKKGLFGKYVIEKADGTKLDPHAKYFVLRYDKDPHAITALKAYINATDNDKLANDLINMLSEVWIDEPNNNPKTIESLEAKVKEFQLVKSFVWDVQKIIFPEMDDREVFKSPEETKKELQQLKEENEQFLSSIKSTLKVVREKEEQLTKYKEVVEKIEKEVATPNTPISKIRYIKKLLTSLNND